MNKEWFEQISSQISYQLYPGLDIEIKDFLGDIDHVEGFSLHTEESIYFIDIKVRAYTIMDVNVVFHTLLQYLEYKGFTLYTNDALENSIEYHVISAAALDQGFYCKITFTKA